MENTALIVIPIGKRSFEINYKVLFLEGKSGSHGLGKLILSQFYNEVEAFTTFESYLTELFKEEIALEIFSCKEVFEI